MISMFSKKSAKGFTLIELLVVIAIIGILSSVVLASLNTARLKSRDTRRVADIKQLQLALALYFDSNAAYPSQLSALQPTYIAAIPKDPVANLDYNYSALGAATGCANGITSYHLGANLEEQTNQALRGDIDRAVGSNSLVACGANAVPNANSADFSGLAVPGGASCSGVAGTAQSGNGTAGATYEACYDQMP